MSASITAAAPSAMLPSARAIAVGGIAEFVRNSRSLARALGAGAEGSNPAAAKAAASSGADTRLDYVTFRSLVQGNRKARAAGSMGGSSCRLGNSAAPTWQETLRIIKEKLLRGLSARPACQSSTLGATIRFEN